MIPASFEYVRPASLEEAIRILNEREGEAKLLAGGYSLIPLLKLRLGQPGILVDLQAVGGLDGIIHTDDDLRIGARATHRQIHESEIIDRYPLLHDVSGGIGDPQVRNWGTIGGSVAHADPASDWPAALLRNCGTDPRIGAGSSSAPRSSHRVEFLPLAARPRAGTAHRACRAPT